MEKIMSKERFVARVLADQAARRAAREDFEAAGEISSESMKMLKEMEYRMGVDHEYRCYAADRRRAMRAKSAKRKIKNARRHAR